MTPIEEARFLTAVLKSVDVPPQRGETFIRRLRIGIWLVLVVAFTFLFQIARDGGVVICVVAFVALILGVVSAALTVQARSLRQWPVISPFVDVEGIRRRLSDLKHNNSLERTCEK
jgi:hypothetical protein